MTLNVDNASAKNLKTRFRNKCVSLILLPLFMTWMSNAGFCQTENSVDHLKWYDDFCAARSESVTTGKFIMLYFSGSDWCKPCIQLTQNIINTQNFSNFADSIIIPMRIDFPRLKKHQLPEERQKANEALANRYNPNGVFPYLVFIDSSGDVKAVSTYSASTPDDFIYHLQALLKR